jgi:S-adenosyl-L-methionine hydrolase (adenosine-forming)
MAIVTLTSDWNKDDFYTAAVQGKVIMQCPGTVFVSVTNQVPAFNISLAAFQLRHAIHFFPEGTIHIIAVNSETKDRHPFVAVKLNNQYFIGYDNGIFGLLSDDEPQEAVLLKHNDPGSFPELTVFAEAACKLIQSGKLQSLGQRHTGLYRQVAMLPAIDESVITGSIIYIDSYRNAFTNINRELFERIGKGRPFELFIQSNHYRINRINTWYSETSSGEILALFNSLNLLEIAIHGGNAAELLNLTLNSTIRIKFKESR